MNKLTLTASSMACALRCPRRYYYDNILGLKLVAPSEALRIGTAVHNGGEAMSVFPRIRYMAPEEQERARRNLLAYCRLDTLAMVKVWEELRRAAQAE